MGKFGNILGLKKFKINGEDIELKPKMGDNKKLMEIMNNTKSKDMDMDALHGYISNLMKRQYPNEDEGEVEAFVEFNILEFIKNIMIAFNWTTEEKWEKQQEADKKKLMSNL